MECKLTEVQLSISNNHSRRQTSAAFSLPQNEKTCSLLWKLPSLQLTPFPTPPHPPTHLLYALEHFGRVEMARQGPCSLTVLALSLPYHSAQSQPLGKGRAFIGLFEMCRLCWHMHVGQGLCRCLGKVRYLLGGGWAGAPEGRAINEILV